jgi:hypothetical protein
MIKKILLTLSLLGFISLPTKAALIEFEKCYSTRGILTENYDDEKLENIKWSKEVYDLQNITLYKQFDEEEFKNFKRKNPKGHIENSKRFDAFNSKFIKEHKKDIADLEKKGWKKINRVEKDVYSINTENGIITRFFVFTPEWLDWQKDSIQWYKAEYKAENKSTSLLEKSYQELLSEPRATSYKYKITSYAGGIIEAKQINSASNYKIIIDVSKNIISDIKGYQSSSENIKICKPLTSFANNSRNFKSYWWVLVVLGAVVFYIYTQTTSEKKNRIKIVNKSENQERKMPVKKDSKVKSNSDLNVFIKFLKDFYQGKVSLPMSYWVVYGCGSAVNYLMFLFLENTALGGLLAIYVIIFTFFAIIGTWRSATNYKIEKQKIKQSGAWGTVAQVLIVLSVLRFFVELLKLFAKN